MNIITAIKNLFTRKPSEVDALVAMIRRRTEIRTEAAELKAKIARLRKNKKKFSHLELRLIELRSELLKLDVQS